MRKTIGVACMMSAALWVAVLCTAQTRPAISVTQVKSTDGRLEGVLVQYPRPQIENQEQFADPDHIVEVMVIREMVRPAWGVYDKNPEDGGQLRAIGFGGAPDSAAAVVFQRGGFFGFSGNREFLFDKGAVYAFSGAPQNSGSKQLVLRPIIGKQQILNRTEIRIGNPPKLIVEIHTSPPSIAREGDFPTANVAATAVRLLLKDGSLKPEWGLFRPAGQTGASERDLLVEGSRISDTDPILYDNSKIWRGFDDLETTVYESDGKGSLRLKRQ